MGSVPLLLMAVAIGITDGWQPNDDGSVDYLIQIPADQVDQARGATITRTIDPKVRGQVSRVIVNVGNRPDKQSMAASDLRKQAAPAVKKQRAPAANLTQPRYRVLKPQTGNAAAAPGLSLPPSLAGGANQAAPGASGRDPMAELSADLAQRTRNEIGTSPSNSASTPPGRTSNILRDALQNHSRGNTANSASTGQNGSGAKQQLPPFTGQNTNELARVRPGGPTTAPTNTRDKKWYGLNTKQSRSAASTDPVDKTSFPQLAGAPELRPGQRQPAAAEQQARSNNGTVTNQPLGSTATFARIPKGINYPESSQQTANAQNQSMSVAEYQRAQYEQQLRQQQQQTNSTASNLGFPNQGISPQARPSTEFTREGTTGAGNGYGLPGQTGQLAMQTSTQNQSHDPRLSPEQIARLPYGAWSWDRHGNPIDYQGRVLDQYGRPVSAQRAYELTSGRSSTAINTDRGRPQGLYQRPSNPPSVASTSPNRMYDRLGQSAGIDPRPRQVTSSSDRSSATQNSSGTTSRQYSNAAVYTSKSRQSLTAQPLFNGLLLMSVVANVYLISWLQKLRLQFRDLVASKRAAASEIAS